MLRIGVGRIQGSKIMIHAIHVDNEDKQCGFEIESNCLAQTKDTCIP